MIFIFAKNKTPGIIPDVFRVYFKKVSSTLPSGRFLAEKKHSPLISLRSIRKSTSCFSALIEYAIFVLLFPFFSFDVSSMLETKKSEKRRQNMLNYMLSKSCFNSGYCVISPYLALDTASCLSSLSSLSKPK